MFEEWIGKKVKVLFLDGNLQSGQERSFEGVMTSTDDQFVFLKIDSGKNVSVGKTFIVKVVELTSGTA